MTLSSIGEIQNAEGRSILDDEMEYSPTGVPGLDELLDNKGIPSGYSVSVIGSPGAGKTTLSMQFLYNGLVKFSEHGIYVSLDENLDALKKAMKTVGIDLKGVVNNGLTLVDATHLVTIPQEVKIGERHLSRQEFSLVSLIESLRTKVQETNAKRVVIDPLAMLTILFPTEIERRVAVADLVHQLSTIGTTTLLLTELQHNGARRSYQIEDYLSQGVISMRKMSRDNHIFNIIQVEKMRGVQHDTQPRFYGIAQGGINVASEESVNIV